MFSRKPSPGTVIALVALFVSLGGSSYAALKITGKDVRRGTLTGKHLKNRSVTGKDVRPNSLGSRHVKDGTLRAQDFRSGELPAGPRGETGPQGPAGAPGAAAMAASASASTDQDVPLSAFNAVVDTAMLRTTITVTERSRILATATGAFLNEPGSSAQCQLVREQPPDFFAGESLGHRLPVPTTGHAFTLAGAVVEGAGTHQIGLHCIGGGGAVFDRADLIVWAVAEPG
jgi:hypothetical protein